MGFATSADVKSYGQELSDQTAAITNLVRAHAELERGERLWAQLAASARATLYREDPLAYWREGVRPLRTNQELTDDDVLQRLRDRNVAILGYLFAHPGAMRADFDEAPEFGPFKNLIRAYWAAPAGGLRIPLTYEDIFPRPLERIVPPVVWRDPKVILVRVRSFDRIEFWLSFALGLVTTFLLLYQDKNFGTGLISRGDCHWLRSDDCGTPAVALVSKLQGRCASDEPGLSA